MYIETASKLYVVPTAQERYNEIFSNYSLEWEKNYALPFQVALDTRTREFQFKILNRIMYMNFQLKKFGYWESASCTFGCGEDETLEHLLCNCRYMQQFWLEVIKWLERYDIRINLSESTNIIFGLYNIDKDLLLVNQLILLGKRSLCFCKMKKLMPNIEIFKSLIKNTKQIEEQLAQSSNKLPIHLILIMFGLYFIYLHIFCNQFIITTE